MTADRLIELLKSAGTDGWSVLDEKKEGWQFYFIRHRLDQNRAVHTEHITVTVYKKTEDGKYLGSASEEIAPTATEEEAEKAVSDLLMRAAYVRNPVYDLRKPTEKPGEAETAPDTIDAAARDFLETMNDLPETRTEDVNSYEIFTNLVDARYVTSTGIDVRQVYPSSMLEVVTNARDEAFLKKQEGGHEIELYRMYLSGTCDREGLKKDITKTLQYGKDRLRTVPTPRLEKIPVLFSTADSVQIYDYFLARMSAQQVYQKISSWKLGEPVAEDATGDRVTIRTRRFLANSSRNLAYDAEGAPVRDEVLIEDGIAKNYWGDAMFSSYLGLADTFRVTNYEAAGGTASEEEIRKGRYLEIVEFSDFQVDQMTGAVFGEIRLGYLHEEDGSITPVSGGSVSGSMRDYAKRMYLSREQVQYDNALVPSVTKLLDVTVTGV